MVNVLKWSKVLCCIHWHSQRPLDLSSHCVSVKGDQCYYKSLPIIDLKDLKLSEDAKASVSNNFESLNVDGKQKNGRARNICDFRN